MYLKFIHIVVRVNSTFLFIAEYTPSYGYTIIYLSNSAVGRHSVVSSFWLLQWSNCKYLCTINIGFHLSWVNTEEWNDWTNDRFLFNILRNQETIFWSGYAILYFYQQFIKVLVPLYLCQRLAWLIFFLILDIFNWCAVRSPCGFCFHFSNDYWDWTYLSSIYLFQISLFNSFAHILIRLFIFLLLNVLRSLYFFEFNLYNWVSMTMHHFTKADGREVRTKG